MEKGLGIPWISVLTSAWKTLDVVGAADDAPKGLRIWRRMDIEFRRQGLMASR